MGQLDVRGLLDGLGDAVIAADRGGRILYANTAAERLLGWARGGLVGQPLTAIQPQRMRAAHLAGFQRYLDTGRGKLLAGGAVRVPALRRDGSEVEVELTLSVQRADDGDEVFVGSLRDLSVRVTLERQVAVTDDLRTTIRLATALGRQGDVDVVARTAVETLTAELGVQAAELWLAGDGGFTRVAAAGHPPAAGDASTTPQSVRHAGRCREPVSSEAPDDPSSTVNTIPLLAAGELQGVLTCRYRDASPEVLLTFPAVVAARLAEVRLIARERHAREETEVALRRAGFLRKASQSLASTLDYEATLANVTRLAVPDMADWCTVDLTSDDGRLRRVAVTHRDVEQEQLLWELGRRRPPEVRANLGPGKAVQTGEAQWLTEMPDELLASIAWDEDHLRLMRMLSPASLVSVPLRARGRTLGAIAFAVTRSGRRFTAEDFELLESLAADAALAVDNARLFEELRAASKAKDESLALLDALFARAPVGLAVTDTDLRYVRVNEALATINGVPAGDHRGRTATDVVGEVGREGDRHRREVLRTGRPVHGLELSGSTAAKPDRQRHWLVNYYPIRPPGGEILGVGSIVVDLTDRKAAEAALENERLFLAAILHNLKDGIVACDADGNLLLFNKATEEFHGRPMQDLPPDEWAEHYGLFHADGVTRLRTEEIPLLRALRGEVIRDVENVIASRHGHRRVVVCNGQAIRDAQGCELGAVVALHDVTERKEAEARLTRQALHDPLTGLPNRLLLMDRIRQALARSGRQEGSLAVLFCDLDRFKIINDSLGHEVGDQLLVVASQRLRSVVRPGDTVARLGGDEFVVLCEGLAGAHEASAVAQRIEAAIAASGLLQGTGADVVVTTSVGIAMARGDERPEELIRNADAAMYRAKERGKARHELFDDSFHVQAIDRLKVENALRRAIDGDRLRLLYQPIADLRTARIVGAEALIRYEDPRCGLVPPSEFLDVAEDSGLIVPIGRWVAVEACRQAREWRGLPGMGDFHVSVNLSARQLGDTALVEALERALAHERLPADAVALEITESVLMEVAGSTLRVLDRLKAAGPALGIDDFGTGYSSLTYLRRFPVDFVKIDRSFVAGLGVDPEDTAIVTAVVGLGKALGLATVAEGVETAGQEEILRDLGCDSAQGYHISRPLAADSLTELLCAATVR